jgi:hypothetical protein
MRVRSIILYFEWRRRTGPLKDQAGNLVLDRFGNQIECFGTWVDPGNVYQCRSAITCVHEKYGHTGSYSEECMNCLQLLEECKARNVPFIGCTVQNHTGNPVLRRKGNPRESPSLRNYLKTLSEETAEYTIQGSEPLDPWEFARVRNHLMSSGDPLDLMFCAIILVGVSLFLREDEVSQITVDDLDFKLSVVSEYAIDSVGVWVQGKRDAGRVLLMLWANHANPQICPVRHLFLWLYVSRIRSGFIFPPSNALNEILEKQKTNPQQIFSSKFQVDYSLVLEKIQDVFYNITARPGPFGTHSMRKTGFVLAIWGGRGRHRYPRSF